MEEERPIDCTSCKKKAVVTYREVISGKIKTTKYCADCPMLKQKISLNATEGEPSLFEVEKNVLCPGCKTSLHYVMTGGSLGCKQCYDAFELVVIEALNSTRSIPSELYNQIKEQKKAPLHFGNIPSKSECPDFTDKLRSLNSALHEALAIENYERAANLRDQIKQLMNQTQKD